MRYSVDWVTLVQEGTGKNGPWKKFKMNLTDEAGKKINDVITFQNVMAGHELEGEVIENSTYKNLEFKPVKKLEKPNFIKKEETMREMQANKARSITEAQDRNMWMWAKYGACELVAGNDLYKNRPYQEQLELINDMATHIYNQEPSTPFND